MADRAWIKVSRLGTVDKKKLCILIIRHILVSTEDEVENHADSNKEVKALLVAVLWENKQLFPYGFFGLYLQVLHIRSFSSLRFVRCYLDPVFLYAISYTAL